MATIVFVLCAILTIVADGLISDETVTSRALESIESMVEPRDTSLSTYDAAVTWSHVDVRRVLSRDFSETTTLMTSLTLPTVPPFANRCRPDLCRTNHWLNCTRRGCSSRDGTRTRRTIRRLVTSSDDVTSRDDETGNGGSWKNIDRIDTTVNRDVISVRPTTLTSNEYTINRAHTSGGRNGFRRASTTTPPSPPLQTPKSPLTTWFSGITITPVFLADGGLSAVVNFQLKTSAMTRGEARNTTSPSASPSTRTMVVVHWMSTDNNVNKLYKQCEEPHHYQMKRINVTYGQNVSCNITQLMYNSNYKVELNTDPNGSKKSASVLTPGCGELWSSSRCLRCKQQLRPPQNQPRDNYDLLVNVSCVEKLDNSSSMASSIRNNIRTDDINSPSATADTAPTTVGVWIVWRLPSDSNEEFMSTEDLENNEETAVKNSTEIRPTTSLMTSRWVTTVQSNNPDFFILTSAPSETQMRLALKPNRIYIVEVTSRNKKRQVVYHSLKINSSQVLAVATGATMTTMDSRGSISGDSSRSQESSSSEQGFRLCHHPYRPEVAPYGGPFGIGDDRSTAVMVGVLSLGTACLTALAVAFHKRCQRRIRNVFIDGKPPMMHSNSYEKSSPSGSFHLFRNGPGGHVAVSDPGHPLDILSSTGAVAVDDWEIDAREVALGVEIGQGAFGRVLTGFYRGNQVAIKVLKDHIPDSYRDDLLREIALMKGVGLHPNIVTMVGACTTRDPIALIMEYVPYGNLQTFLKKCRVDRESHRAADRDNITYCLVDELSGHKECWHITAMDVLSFARQAANAMEYLSERHFVHRDLAARNVLLGYSKVVKLCDFGLARAVYTGDQYYKLTSGRLPLKWMALESIRDRIFTTCSDVWSFGILLWEIVTMGASPYPNIALADVYRLLAEGYRMPQPKNCSDDLYDIMSQCWCENPADRPTFTIVRRQLEHLLCRSVDYLDLDNIDAPLAPRSQSTADSNGCTGSNSGTTGNQASSGMTGAQLLNTAVAGLQGVAAAAAANKERSDLLLCASDDEDYDDDDDTIGEKAMLHLDIC